MNEPSRSPRARRRFMVGLAGLAAVPLLPLRGSAQDVRGPVLVEARLVAEPATVQVVPKEYPRTEVWAYNGMAPGPVLRARQGDRLRVRVENRLEEPTTVHWHGIRLPNAMDGVPVLTQPPIAPGSSFVYDFTLPDAGTYFYHPHQRGFEQMGRGLAGALIVEERTPPKIERDLLWVLSDWRLAAGASIRGGFGNFMDVSHAGRIGNTVTINGQIPEAFRVRAGERIRLRLVATSNARIFALDFRGHRPWIVALDGQPVEPHEPAGGVVVLAPAQRADLVIDMTGAPGSRHEVRDLYYGGREYRLIEFAYADEPARRGAKRGEGRRRAGLDRAWIRAPGAGDSAARGEAFGPWRIDDGRLRRPDGGRRNDGRERNDGRRRNDERGRNDGRRRHDGRRRQDGRLAAERAVARARRRALSCGGHRARAMGVLLRAGLNALRRRIGAHVNEAAVRRALNGQAGISAIESVRLGAGGGATLVAVRIRVAEGCDAREVTRRATEAVCARLPVLEVSVISTEP